MKHGKHLRVKENPVSRSFWHRCMAALLSVVMLAGVMIPTAAGAGLGANVEFSAKIVKDTGDSSQVIDSVDSGDSFFLALDYKFSSSPDGVSYGSAAIAIQLPEYVYVEETGSVVTAEFKQPEVSSLTLPDGSDVQYVTIPCQDHIDQGKAGTIYLKCYFKNMVTPDATVGNFTSILFTGTLTKDGTDETEKLDQRINSVSITSRADQQWNISKTVTDPNPVGEEIPVVTKNADGDYEVTYQIAVTDPIENMNRYGRLDCEEFSVTDILPVADRENGGAQLVSVGYLDRSNQLQPLTENNGYTKETNADGSLKSLAFQYVNTFDKTMVGEGQVRVPDGSLLPTTYQVTVKFDGDAYKIPTNLPFVRAILDNQAKLNYKPLAKDPVAKDSNAKVQVGDVEDKTTPVSLIVEKTLTIQGDNLAVTGNTFVLNGAKQAIYGNAQFTLYSDEACTQVAKDIDGNDGAGAGQMLDGTGRVTFSNLRHGTYYLKETQTPDGFTGSTEAIKVVLNEDGTLTVGTKTQKQTEPVAVDNTTDKNGPGYVAFWKKGLSSSESTERFLQGAAFQLTNKNDGSKVYTAVSGADGLVLFEGIPAGQYTLKETGVPAGGEYEVSSKTYDVTVVGNQVNYPAGLSMDGNKPYLLNQSEKGKLKIVKVDSTDDKVKLPGAEFELYGPYADESAVPVDADPAAADLAAKLTTGADGTITSEALAEGWYLLREVKAPDTYAIMQKDRNVQITKNTTVTLQIENAQRGALQIIKYGQLTIGDVVTESKIPLKGAEFGVYTDSQATQLATDANGNPAKVTTDVNGSDPDTPTIPLDPGTYYVKEILAPAGYQTSDKIYTVEVKEKAIVEVVAENIVDKQGQIKIQKQSNKTGNIDLSGAVFEVYKAADTEMKELMDTITTDASGVGYSKFLPSGSYVLKEVTSIAGHMVPSEAFKGVDGSHVAVPDGDGIVVVNNALTDVIVKNDPYVAIKLHKVDSVKTGTSLSGAQFALYKTEADAENDQNRLPIDGKPGSADSITTGANGEAVFTGLTPGAVYWYREIAAPSNYFASSTPVQVTAPDQGTNFADLTVEVKNDPYGKFQIYKEGGTLDQTTTMQPLAGAEFQYYPNLLDGNPGTDLLAAQGNGTLKTIGPTGADGTLTSPVLKPGKYWVVETKAPEGYALDSTPKEVTVAPGAGIDGYSVAMVKVTFTDEFESGKVQIKKVSSLNSAALLQASFKVQKQADGVYTDYPDSANPLILTTGTNGTVTSGWLPAGEYQLIEQSVTGEYVVDSTPHKFTVTPGETNKVYFDTPIENTPKRRIGIDKFEIWKVNDAADLKLRQVDVTFEIYTEDPTVNTGAQPFTTITSASETRFTGYLAPGDYWIKEIVPANYQVDSVTTDGAVPVQVTSSVYKVTLAPDKDLVVTWNNVSDKSRIELIKVDQTDHETKLTGAEFTLYKVVDSTTEGAEQIQVNGQMLWLKVIREKITSGTLEGVDGGALTELLDTGVYYLQETKAPPYDKNYYYQISKEWTGPIEVTEADEGKIVGPVIIENYMPVGVEGKKIDQDGNALNGAWVALFQSEADAQKAQTALNGDEDFFSKKLSGGQLPEAVMEEYKMLQAVQSKDGGVLHFVNLQPNTAYYALEIIGVNYYVHSLDIHKVYAKQDGQQWKLYEMAGAAPEGADPLFQLENLAYGMISVKKTLEISGVTYPLNQVKFNVYVADSQDKTKPLMGADGQPVLATTIVTGTGSTEAGLGISSLLKPGWYVIREVEAPEHVQFDPETAPYYSVYVSSDGKDAVAGQVFRDNDAGWTINCTYENNPIENESAWGQVKIKKISADAADSGKKLTATFKVQKDQGGGNYADYPEGNAMTITMDPAKDFVVSGFLPAGNYQLVETTVQAGYTLDPTPIPFVIEANRITGIGYVKDGVYYPSDDKDANPGPIVIENEKQGSLKLTKLGDILGTKNPLSGVTFQLYAVDSGDPDVDCAGTAIRTVTTGANGLISMTNLDAGDYWLKETSVGAAGSTNVNNGFVAGMVVRVTIEAGKETVQFYDPSDLATPKTELLNTTTYGKLQIVKQDAADEAEKLGGVRFGIYSDSTAATKVGEMTTAVGTGAALSGLLPAGEYWLKELNTPTGYFPDTTTIYGPYTVEANQTTSTKDGNDIVIENTKIQKVTVIKVNSKTNAAIPGAAMKAAKFELWDQKEDEGGKVLQTVTGQETIVFNNLQPNTTYYVKEVIPPTGYTFEAGKEEYFYEVTTGNTGAAEVTIQNDPLGSISLVKKANWENPDPQHILALPLEGVTFELHRYDGSQPGGLGELVQTEVTDSKGEILFEGLEPGDYMLKEQVPADFVEGTTLQKLTVVKGETNTVYTGDNYIVNHPNKGRFTFTKFKGDGTTPLTVTQDSDRAEFALYKGDKADADKLVDTFRVRLDGTFESASLDAGTYTIVETKAPSGFTLDPTPISFTITAKQITSLDGDEATKVINQAKGNLQFVKQGDNQNGNPKLNTAEFQLYDKDKKPIGDPLTNVTNGVYRWEGLDAGTYYIRETKAPDGYAQDTNWYEAVIPANQNDPTITYDPKDSGNMAGGVLTNVSDSGRIRIEKVGENKEKLNGAEFKVYQLGVGDSQGQQVGGVITIENGVGVSDLLPAASGGTKYWVVETKAPDGYTLDERYYPTQKIVTVLPVQELSRIEVLGVENNVSFTNKSKTDIIMFNTGILKEIPKEKEKAPKSLLEEPFTVPFMLSGYAEGTNELAATQLVVTDQDIKMQYQDANKEYQTEPTRQDAYLVNWVKVYQAYNAQSADHLDTVDASKPVAAKVQYQAAENLGSTNEATWRDVPNGTVENVQNLGAEGTTVAIPKGLEAMAFRVVYTGVKEHFVAKGVDFEVTFNQRPSDATLHEITRITNTAAYEYTFIQKDEEGEDVLVTDGKPSNTVEAKLPLIENIRIPVSLVVRPEGTQTTYAPNSDVTFAVTAKNESGSEDFREPIISFDLPVGTTLNDFVEGSSQFVIMKMWEDENGDTVGTNLTPDLLSIDTVKATKVENGQLVKLEQETQKVTMTFPDVSLKPGERIVIRFAAHIDPNSQADTLWCPAYLGSSYQIPQSAENQYGVSYAPVITGDGGSFEQDKDLDDILGNGGSHYVNNYADIVVGQNSNLSIYKQVKGEYDDRYKNYSELGHTAPGGSIDYKIRVSNGSDDPAKTTRVVDILPFLGDTLTDRTDTTVVNRATDLARRAVLNSVTVLGSDGQPINDAFVRIYYSTDDTSAWTAEERAKVTAEQELPMIYTTGKNSDPWASSAHSWSLTPPDDMSTVTAIGVEVTMPLSNGQYIEVDLNMTAPQYATSEVEDFYGKFISNSAMCSVVRNSNTGDTIALSDRPENQEVKCVLDLPKGAIGDYAFYDNNQNGIQDDGDLPVAGIEVTLHTTKMTADGTQETTTTTTTDSQGLYLFDNLDCNILLSGKENADPDDPGSYVGGAIYEYQVEFQAPPAGDGGAAYVPTRRYAGTDDTVDSNIGEDRRTEVVRLGLVENPDTHRPEGQRDMTLDAGFVIPAALGDYVWIDTNRNGVQEPDESGINGARVRLYTVDDSGKVSDTPLMETVTAAKGGQDGYYLFDGLTKGRYVVEFDITSLRNDVGIYQYGFTKPNQGAGDQAYAADSDAKHIVGSNDRVMRTDVISLDYQQTDLTWDAGLVYYSALGGYAFDDRNYNDIQDLGIPLTGTKVFLYQVINNVREADPIASTTVDENGEYLFPYLLEGEYQVFFQYPAGYQAVKPNIGGDDTRDSDVFEIAADLNSGYTETITLPANSISLHHDGGARIYGAIGDYVWKDANKNGIQDAGEEPVPDVTVYLQMREGDSGIWRKADTTTTNEKGYYVFENVMGGPDVDYQYRVCFDLRDDYYPTISYAGSDRAVDSNVQGFLLDGWGYPTDRISIGYGQRDMTIDAGIITTSGSVGDYVWLDTNRNGIQDEENTGLAGIPVILEYSPSGDVSDNTQWVQVGETTTNEMGKYQFDDLTQGYYRVKFQLLDPYTITLVNQGDPALDSDGRYPLGGGWYATRPFYLVDGGYDMTWDCGVVLGTGGTPPPGNGVTTGDRMVTSLWMLLAGLSAFGALVFGVTLSRKRKTGRH